MLAAWISPGLWVNHGPVGAPAWEQLVAITARAAASALTYELSIT